MFVIQKISVDARGHIDRVQWQPLDQAGTSWVGPPSIVPVAEVVRELREHRVGSVVAAGGGVAKLGPYARTAIESDGTRGIEDDLSEWCESSLSDLPRL